MNLATFTTFLAILENGTFAAAAEKVGCTPSAVSLQVKQLEAYFGKPLFDRSTRVLKPTPFAEAVAEVARETTAKLEALRTRSSIGVGGRLRVGAITSVQTDFFPQALRMLKEKHPALEIAISPLADTDVLLEALNGGAIDAAVVTRPEQAGARKLIWHDLYRQPFVMLAPMGSEDRTPQDLLRRLPWISYDRQVTGGRQAAAYIRRIAPGARSAMELRSIDAIVGMVSEGLGVSVVPRPRNALLSIYRLHVIALGRSAPYRQISLALRKADEDSRNIGAFRQLLQHVLAERSKP